MTPIRDLANELGVDVSHLRKLGIRLGITFHRGRFSEKHNQVVIGLDQDGANRLRAHRESFSAQPEFTTSGDGYLYIVQLEPDLIPARHKLGFASNPHDRLTDYRCANPNAIIVKTWPCRRTWEKAAIDALTDSAGTHIGGEVFDLDDVPEVIAKGDSFFSLLPAV